MPIVSYVKHLMLKKTKKINKKTTKTKLHATSALAYICTTHYGSSSSLPHKHNTVQCVCLLSFDLASKAHSYLEAQPGGVLADGRNAYKCKQSHLKAAENGAHTLLATEHMRRYSLKVSVCKHFQHTHLCPGSWMSAWCCLTGRWAAEEASDYLRDSDDMGLKLPWEPRKFVSFIYNQFLLLNFEILAIKWVWPSHIQANKLWQVSPQWAEGGTVTSVSPSANGLLASC